MVFTYKNKFNAKYGFPKDTSHSVSEIARLTGYKKSGLDTIVQKGRGAFFSNHASVRPNVSDPTHWGMSRLYSAVTGGKAARVDAAQLIKQ
jgi:hypothetical protein